MVLALIPSCVLFVYARIRPPVPSRVPPKYLVTTATTLCSSCPVNTSSIGFPAVPLGSPSSLHLNAGCFSPMLYAQQLCLASQYCFFIFSTKSCASSSVCAGAICAINLDFFSEISASPSLYKILYL